MAQVKYRKIVIRGNTVNGETNEFGSWMKFSGTKALLTISYCMNLQPKTITRFMQLADGYGEPGFFPAGYDWSGIRDSSAAARAAMYKLAIKLLGNTKLPWEKK